MERVGFRREGVLRGWHVHASGVHDVVVFALLRSEWETSDLLAVPAEVSGEPPPPWRRAQVQHDVGRHEARARVDALGALVAGCQERGTDAGLERLPGELGGDRGGEAAAAEALGDRDADELGGPLGHGRPMPPPAASPSAQREHGDAAS